MNKFFLLLVVLLIQSAALAEPREALCRVHNQLVSFNNVGSGTLVDKADDGREGLVLTCAHLFGEGVGRIIVDFPGGKSHEAKLVAIDRDADLAALAIGNPMGTGANVAFEFPNYAHVKACGFGPQGEYRCAEGPILGGASGSGQVSVLVGDAVRSGDSGGGVFDSDGNLIAVVWGESQGVTYASTGPPLRRFLDRVLGNRTSHVYACPNGVCPRPIAGGVHRPPVAPAQPNPPFNLATIADLERRIALLAQNKQDRGDYVTRGDLAAFMPRSEVEGFARTEDLVRQEGLLERLEGLISKPSQVGNFVGITGVSGWGAILATSIGGWLVGRLVKRGAGGRRQETFRNG